MADETEETTPGEAIELSEDGEPEFDETKSAPADRETAGPLDSTEVTTMRPYVELGALKIVPREGLQLRLEVDERTKRVVAVTLSFADSVLQMQAFAAPRSTGMWHRVRGDLQKQLTSQGAKVQEFAGEFGPELRAQTTVKTEQGTGTRTMRFIGVDGPRWLLRGVIMGRAAVDSEAEAKLIPLFRETVVVRGDNPVPPGELLPLKMPAGTQGAGNQEQGAQPGQAPSTGPSQA